MVQNVMDKIFLLLFNSYVQNVQYHYANMLHNDFGYYCKYSFTVIDTVLEKDIITCCNSARASSTKY